MNLLGKTRKFARLIRTPEYWRPFITHGVAAAVEHGPLLESLSCETVVDIGAHEGQFAMVARRANANARIISFEPLSAPAARYISALRRARVDLHQVAIGPRTETAVMHVSRHDDSSSLLPIGELQTTIFPGTEETRTERVSVRPLTDFLAPADLNPPALLKIDVQGYEFQVLEGCGSLLAYFEFVYVECSFLPLYEGQRLAGDVVRFLDSHDFGFAGVFNVSYSHSGRCVQADMLFQRTAWNSTSEAVGVADLLAVDCQP